MKLISDTSPLIFLAKLDVLSFLAQDEIIIPMVVKEELLAKETSEKDHLAYFFKHKHVKFHRAAKRHPLSTILGIGEIETILIALEKKVPHVLLDDRRARSLARLNHLKPKGTLWVILRAYTKNKIDQKEARALIHQLPKIGFRIDEVLLIEVLKRLETA